MLQRLPKAFCRMCGKDLILYGRLHRAMFTGRNLFASCSVLMDMGLIFTVCMALCARMLACLAVCLYV